MTGLHRVVNRQSVRVPKRQSGSGENGVFVPGREHDWENAHYLES